MFEKIIATLGGTKFIGFLLSGFAFIVALTMGKIEGGEFVDGVIWVFGIYAGGNVANTVGSTVGNAMKAKKVSHSIDARGGTTEGGAE